MARVRPRTAALILGVTLVASAVAGYAWSNRGSSDSVELTTPGTFAEPGAIATAPKLAGSTLPAVDVLDLEGNKVATSSLLGQPLVINLWFSTCVPCEQELPAFAKIHAELGDKVRFVGIDPQDPATTTKRFADAHGVQYELLRDEGGVLIGALKIGTFPATLFVAPDGRVVELRQGALDADTLRAKITKDLLS